MRIKIEAEGTPAELLTDLHCLIDSILPDLAKDSGGRETKEHLLTLLYQNILKEWSVEENENE